MDANTRIEKETRRRAALHDTFEQLQAEIRKLQDPGHRPALIDGERWWVAEITLFCSENGYQFAARVHKEMVKHSFSVPLGGPIHYYGARSELFTVNPDRMRQRISLDLKNNCCHVAHFLLSNDWELWDKHKYRWYGFRFRKRRGETEPFPTLG